MCAVFPTEKNFSQQIFENIVSAAEKSRNIVIVSHYLPRHFSAVDLERLNKLYEINPNILFIAGHEHYDRFDGKCHVVRGLDPDKAIGGMPAVAFFEYDENSKTFNRENIECVSTNFSADERELGGLGIFIAKKTMDSIAYAYENGENILTMTKKI